MKVHRIEQEQTLAVTLAEAWEFFSDPRNLDEITPSDLGFRIVDCPEGAMYEGEIITYRVKILPLVWIGWVTEIKAVEPGAVFVDEQRAGPYRLWHHRHVFEEVPGGVRVRDVVNYALGWSVFGELAHRVFVRRKLEWIFRYRREILAERFGEVGADEKVKMR